MMPISKQWTDAERRYVISELARQLVLAADMADLKRIRELADTINYVALMGTPFLEMNRTEIMKDAGLSAV